MGRLMFGLAYRCSCLCYWYPSVGLLTKDFSTIFRFEYQQRCVRNAKCAPRRHHCRRRRRCLVVPEQSYDLIY